MKPENLPSNNQEQIPVRRSPKVLRAQEIEAKKLAEERRGITRRRFLKGALGAAAAVIALGATDLAYQAYEADQKRKNDPFNWDGTPNDFSSDRVVSMGNEMIASPYSSIAESGNIVVASQSPDFFKDQISVSQPPVTLQWDPTLRTDSHAEAALKTNLTWSDFSATLIKIDSHTPFQASLRFPKSAKFSISVQSGINPTSDIAKELLLAKEFSHFKYIPQIMDGIYSKATSRFELPNKDAQGNPIDQRLWLYGSAFARAFDPDITELYPGFGDVNRPLDAAGYFHIILDYLKIRDASLFTQTDLQILGIYGNIAEKAIEEGYILKPKRGEYGFTQGSGPFDSRWQDIVYAVTKLPSAPSPFSRRINQEL